MSGLTHRWAPTSPAYTASRTRCTAALTYTNRLVHHPCAPAHTRCTSAWLSRGLLLVIFDRSCSPLVGLLLRFIPGNAVAFLQSSDQLISVAGDQVKIVVR